MRNNQYFSLVYLQYQIKFRLHSPSYQTHYKQALFYFLKTSMHHKVHELTFWFKLQYTHTSISNIKNTIAGLLFWYRFEPVSNYLQTMPMDSPWSDII